MRDKAMEIQTKLQLGLGRGTWQGIEVVEFTGSTNNDLKDAAQAGAFPCAVRMALRQDAGRGSRGRGWQAPLGGLWISFLIPASAAIAPVLGIMGGVAAAQALLKLGVEGARLKWPNDVLLDGRKAGGILAEWLPAPLDSLAVLGIGLNFNLRESDFAPELANRAISTFMLTGKEIDLAEAAETLAREVSDGLALLSRQGVEALVLKAEELLAWRGEVVSLAQDGVRREGFLSGLTTRGGLMLRKASGELEVHSSGQLELASRA